MDHSAVAFRPAVQDRSLSHLHTGPASASGSTPTIPIATSASPAFRPSCAICGYGEENDIHFLNVLLCGHQCHGRCLVSWMSGGNEGPVCCDFARELSRNFSAAKASMAAETSQGTRSASSAPLQQSAATVSLPFAASHLAPTAFRSATAQPSAPIVHSPVTPPVRSVQFVREFYSLGTRRIWKNVTDTEAMTLFPGRTAAEAQKDWGRLHTQGRIIAMAGQARFDMARCRQISARQTWLTRKRVRSGVQPHNNDNALARRTRNRM